MTLRRLPLLPTALVLIAVAVMVRLGFWQLDRMHQKDALLVLYARNQALSSEALLLADKASREQTWFRHTTLDCKGAGMTRPMAGHNVQGQTGWAQWGKCYGPDGRTPVAEINYGWSTDPRAVAYGAGTVGGIIAPDGANGARVVSARPLPGLQPSAAPNPADMPNNHLSYAVQWFAFAATALVIYALALRKKMSSVA
ncbi:cytochrome oxidase assembly protein ShyY1 [Novosphingobium kunmingense]|uniref:SURF1-like protein n=1 Tax=Novosphingobium kunmingense TaxID=1211806 RepID=A0A2N0I490_9SPHN|nr:SURF1 family cytochrome oxidase biogenesis protein [Novosphingobium kunmingense]PKB25975.1 cytochrome oxidase assembly protein ShyY1 [Novosphingobium kunmingense]